MSCFISISLLFIILLSCSITDMYPSITVLLSYWVTKYCTNVTIKIIIKWELKQKQREDLCSSEVLLFFFSVPPSFFSPDVSFSSTSIWPATFTPSLQPTTWWQLPSTPGCCTRQRSPTRWSRVPATHVQSSAQLSSCFFRRITPVCSVLGRPCSTGWSPQWMELGGFRPSRLPGCA